MIITIEQLEQTIPTNKNIPEWCDTLNSVLPEYEINTPERIAMFIAQCAHESVDFKFLKENLNYQVKTLQRTFYKRFPTVEAAQPYALNAEKLANLVYSNRMGNGDEASGDGFRYIGRGLLQLTGKENYQKFADFMQLSLDDVVDYLTTYEGAVTSACWYWTDRNINEPSDARDVVEATRRINGGKIGIIERTQRYEKALEVFVE